MSAEGRAKIAEGIRRARARKAAEAKEAKKEVSLPVAVSL